MTDTIDELNEIANAAKLAIHEALADARDEHEATVAASMTEAVTDPERLADMALLSKAIAASGLSASAFARDILVRNPRQIFRSLKGENPLSPVVRAKCQAVIDLAEPRKRQRPAKRQRV